MITEKLSKQVLDYIISDVEFTLHRLGFNTALSIEKRKNYKGDEYEVLVSTSFQTMPVLFREIHIEGDIAIVEDKKREHYMQVYITLDTRFKNLNGGSNGAELGSVLYKIDERANKKMIEDKKDYKYMSMIVEKIQPLVI